MGFRKIIGFGDSSFVVSLPKDWVVKNNLKKGDVVSIEGEDNWLKVTPQNIKPIQVDKDITIEYTKSKRDLKSRLVYAYINGYNVINIKRPDIEKYVKEIRDIISNFVGLDIVEQKKGRIIVNDVLDISGMSVYNLVRRMDRMVISMAEDVRLVLEGKEIKTLFLDQKDEDINKLCNLVLKLLRKAHNANDMHILGLKVDEIFYYWDIVLDMEDVADQLKRIVRSFDGKTNKDILKMFDTSIENYNTAMKANYVKDGELAVDLMVQRKEFFTKCEEIGEDLSHKQILILEKIKLIHNFSGNIAKTLLKLGMPSQFL